jgi:hypothetical protein
MAHAPLKLETLEGSSQVTVEGLLQMTVLEDGTVTIDLAGNRIEVERHMPEGRLVIRHERDDVIDAPSTAGNETSSK